LDYDVGEGGAISACGLELNITDLGKRELIFQVCNGFDQFWESWRGGMGFPAGEGELGACWKKKMSH